MRRAWVWFIPGAQRTGIPDEVFTTIHVPLSPAFSLAWTIPFLYAS
ncbi:MAG TPA: hypothetical protein VEI46_03615 [Thermodesulfovibrionales bacterium]|nr:hypothetical protein [Thermodesulfovibrionales bacterium]